MDHFIKEEVILKDLLKSAESHKEKSESESSSTWSFSDSSTDNEGPSTSGRNTRVSIPNYVEEVVCKYTDIEFKSHFRMRRETAYKIIDILNQSNHIPKQNDGRQKISGEKAFLTTLWYLSNTESFREVSDRFNITISSAHRCLKRVLKFLLSIRGKIIKWPNTDEAKVISEAFRQKQGINDIVGCIDGSHIEIPKPADNQTSYINRKGYHSLLVQVIVDHEKRFIDVFCGVPGSMNDARLLRKSNIYLKIDSNPDFIGNKIVLGDSAYPNLHWLVTPIKDYGNLTQQQKEFNHKISSTIMVVENSLGLLKGRFRRLRRLENIDLTTCSEIIMGACVLHNICLKEGDFIATEATDCEQPDHTVYRNLNADLAPNVNRQLQIFNAMYN